MMFLTRLTCFTISNVGPGLNIKLLLFICKRLAVINLESAFNTAQRPIIKSYGAEKNLEYRWNCALKASMSSLSRAGCL